MAKIKQLLPHEAQKIAAGEVVERPANIVKELVENSIDADATRINIYVEDGGKQLIRIVDNGCGMDYTDAQICFDRHATSKITHVDELESLDTFGFRGEALASIASVSQITLITKEESSLEGTKIVINANNIQTIDSVACAIGTDISVHNLFFNVPARKKFLKATQTEWRAIQLLFNAFCFDYPHIHFLLFSDGKQILNCPATTTLKNRALQLWEPSIHTHLIELQADEHSTISLSGVISDHQHYRYDRSGIYFFVNKRWVKNQHLSSAFIKGYANVLAAGKYPVAAIHITVPSNEVDINIHPRKEEVKFLHPRRVEQALQQAVKTTLEQNLSQHLKREVTFQPFVSFDKLRTNGVNALSEAFTTEQSRNIRANEWETQNFYNQNPFVVSLSNHTNDNPFPINDDQQTSSLANSSPFVLSLSKDTNGNQPAIQQLLTTQNSDATSAHKDVYRLIGQYNTTYLLVEKEDGLFLVDQHAAHERILYELFSQRFNEVATIQLMFPHIITLLQQDITTITPHLDIFTNNGIIIEQCASDQLIVQSLPVHLKDQSLTDIVRETISWITEHASLDEQGLKKMLNNKLQAQMACKAAVKAGDILTQEKMEQLLRDLEKTANRFSCPHGRPTGWLLSLHEIEKKFKRRI
jgi:DNA mismatch repair protein MutL